MATEPIFDVDEANRSTIDASPEAVIAHALAGSAGKALISTNFRPQEAVLLHMVSQQQPDIPVLWVDHGYNTPETYRCAEAIIERLGLNIHLFIPRRTAAHREAVSGGIPSLDDQAAHDAFTEEVKLEPFRRGLASLQPSVWFTALRREQTAFRAGMSTFEAMPDGVVKVSPLLDWDSAAMETYLAKHQLPDERTYFDPTKVEGARECGLHPKLHSS
ncbi:MAG: phosphoadenylylsulfate reductase [Planctomycetota bacterium]|nr:MAG: phosphoadenylylsulfate reductase [Planctomycetota bacterium]